MIKPTEPQLFACFLNNSVCMNRKLNNVFNVKIYFYNKFTMVIMHVLTRWDGKSFHQKAICLLNTAVQCDTITPNNKIFVV